MKIATKTTKLEDVVIPDVIKGFALRMNDKTQPQWVRDNNRRTLEGVKAFLDKVLKTA